MFPLSEQTADDGREAVGVAHQQEGDEREQIVDERSRRQRVGAVAAHHGGVGKAQDDYAKLADGDGEAQTERRPVVWLHEGGV